MHIIIGGAGDTGTFIAEELSKKDLEGKYSVTVIDENYNKIQKLNQQFNVATICGSIVDLPILREAIHKETKAFIACTHDEETNLISCILAHDIGVEKNIAVTNSSIYTKKEFVEKYSKSGVEKIINITEVICNEVLNLAKFSLATQLSSFVEGKVVMFGLIVTEESSFVDKFLYQIPKDSFFLIGCDCRDPASSHQKISLVHYLLAHTKNSSLSSMGGDFRQGIVHRLDKDTSGLLVVAKNNLVHENLIQQFKSHSIIRKYLCFSLGNSIMKSGTIEKKNCTTS